MGGTKKSGKGGGGGGRGPGRNCAPTERVVLRKDPGVPGEDLKKVGRRLAHTAAVKQGRVEARRRAKRDMMKHLDQDDTDAVPAQHQNKDASALAAMVLNARRREAHFQESGVAPSGQLGSSLADELGKNIIDRDVSLRRFYKDFKTVVEQSDVILEVLDGRDPMGCRLRQLEMWISSQFSKKTILLVLNKVDLLPHSDIVTKWSEYFSNEHLECVPFTTKSDAGSAQCIAKLFKVLRRIAKGDGLARKSITVGVVGYPNVGKSSVINALKRKRVVGVGNTPGFTTGPTEVELRSDVKIIDSPGVVMPGEDTGDVVLRNAMKVDQLANPVGVVARLFERSDPAALAALYGVPEPTSAHPVDEFLTSIGWKRGRVRQGGSIDDMETARIVLKDWNDGRIGYYTAPPESHEMFLQQQEQVLSGAAMASSDAQAGGNGPQLIEGGLTHTAFNASNLPQFHLRFVGEGREAPKAWIQGTHEKRKKVKICYNPLDAIDGTFNPNEDDDEEEEEEDDYDDDAYLDDEDEQPPTTRQHQQHASSRTTGGGGSSYWTFNEAPVDDA